MALKKTEHGYPILDQKPSGKAGMVQFRIILAYLEHNEVTPFVTWTMDCLNGECYWGHYHRELKDAVIDFDERN